jgi:hypothetical protein
VTAVAIGHHVQTALAVAEHLAELVDIEVFDPRTIYPFDWHGQAASLEQTGRLTAAERMRQIAPPRRVTRPNGAVLPFARELGSGSIRRSSPTRRSQSRRSSRSSNPPAEHHLARVVIAPVIVTSSSLRQSSAPVVIPNEDFCRMKGIPRSDVAPDVGSDT